MEWRGMEGGRSICLVINCRTLEDFIMFYILLSSLFKLNSNETMISELPHLF